jgi:RNA polymerase sigma-70 factor (ECF subfamily)
MTCESCSGGAARTARPLLQRVRVRLSLEHQLAAMRADLLKSARGWAGCRADAEDLVQGAFALALKRQKPLCGGEVRAWLQTILRNLAIDGWRQRKQQIVCDPSQMDRLPSPDPAPPQRWRFIGPAHVHAALLTCRPRYRETYQLHFVDGLSNLQIAGRLGITPAAVATRIFRARVELRKILERQLGEAALPTEAAA